MNFEMIFYAIYGLTLWNSGEYFVVVLGGEVIIKDNIK